MRHHYASPVVRSTLPSKATRLDEGAFRAARKSWSLDFSKVCSTSSSPSWFSPPHANFNLGTADLELLRQLASSSELGFRSIGYAWRGQMMKST